MLFRRRTLFLFAVCLSLSPLTQSQTPKLPELKDGAAVRVSGLLVMERRGNNRFLMVRAKASYLAIFYEDEGSSKVGEMGIELAGEQAGLEKHLGEQVTVVGKVQLSQESPYYFNGVLIVAESVELANGTVLRSHRPEAVTPIAVGLPMYRVQVTLKARTSHFSYVVSDERGRLIAPNPAYMSCGLNGAGDVVNCYCAEGFDPLDKHNPGVNRAQFEIDEPLRKDVTKTVECRRKAK